MTPFRPQDEGSACLGWRSGGPGPNAPTSHETQPLQHVGPSEAPAGGCTLAPGLIDSHVHAVVGDYTPRQQQLHWIDTSQRSRNTPPAWPIPEIVTG